MANQELKDRIFSKSNKHTVATKLDTWADVAAAAGFNDPYSLDVDMVYHIAACLWKAGYRSLDSYLAVARQEMIIKHGCIPDSLALHFKRISRAASRGRGPAKQATELPFQRLQELGDPEAPLAPSGPCYPVRFAIIASWWMLREIEASNLTLDCVSFEDKVAHLRLPTSKVDHTGKGTTRSLCCTCSSLSSLLCPFHILETQYSWASSKSHAGSSPLFPTLAGVAATKKATVQSIFAMAGILNLKTHTLSGAPRFTGHTFRVTGAMFLASSGIDIWRIQIHGRWGSATVLRYVRLAPLAKSLALEASLGKDLSEVRTAILDAKATLSKLSVSSTTVGQEDMDEILASALGPTLSAATSYLGAPKLDHILGNASVKGWHRVPEMGELLVANIGPPEYSGKLHSLRPPQLHHGPPPQIGDWHPRIGKAWCSWNFVAAGARAEFSVWDNGEECKQAPLCFRCFGRPKQEDSAAETLSSGSSAS